LPDRGSAGDVPSLRHRGHAAIHIHFTDAYELLISSSDYLKRMLQHEAGSLDHGYQIVENAPLLRRHGSGRRDLTLLLPLAAPEVVGLGRDLGGAGSRPRSPYLAG